MIISLVSFQITTSSQPCLPEGITFTTQAQIDCFQVNYPGCTEIEGNVTISGSDITNLNGLSVVTSIGGDLYIYYNDALTSLTGLNNINGSSISNLTISLNFLLSSCAVQSICDYLAAPNGTIEIHDNAIGCNSQEEVEAACGIGVDNIISDNGMSVYPNPSSDQIVFKFDLIKPSKVKIEVLNNMGQIVSVMLKSLSQGEQQVIWNTKGLPAGVYFYRLIMDKQPTATGKLMVVR